MAKPTPSKRNNKLKKRDVENGFTQRFALAWKDTFNEYIHTTRLSGMWLLRKRFTQGWTRWFWTTMLFTLCALSIYLMLLQWISYYSYPIITNISERVPITDIPFPGITLCSYIGAREILIKKFVKSIKIPNQYNESQVIEGFTFLNGFTSKYWTYPADKSYKALEATLKYNNITLFQAAEKVQINCSVLVQRCFWANIEFPCFELNSRFHFITTATILGPCCSFNFNPYNSTHKPFTSNVFGMSGGLTISGHLSAENDSAYGVLLYVHHPHDFITENNSPIAIKNNAVTFVEISPTLHLSSAEVLDLSYTKRFCIISEDINVVNYRRPYCIIYLQLDTIIQNCKCAPYNTMAFLEGTGRNVTECTLADVQCYWNSQDKVKTTNYDICLPNCFDVSYNTNFFSINYDHDLLPAAQFAPKVSKGKEQKSFYMVSTYLRTQTVPTLSKVVVMSWISLLSNLGGIFNLCLGLSMISLIEFLYFVTCRLYVHYRAHKILMVAPM